MSIPREKAIEILNDEEIVSLVGKFHGGKEALDLALTALRPVSREQVERMWKGEWIALDECANEGVYCSKCKKKVYRIEYANEKMKSSFCPHCGAPMTDVAVEMAMERLEALYEQ